MSRRPLGTEKLVLVCDFCQFVSDDLLNFNVNMG
jgi:hypothetical protein